jgi:diguanylate cyclase (GGDEF)-like protein
MALLLPEIPMIARGEILGLLQISSTDVEAEQQLQEISGIGVALTDAVMAALANLALRDKLRSRALRDPLTGLYNRRYMEDTLQRIARLSDRERSDLSVIMIDLDHFKRLNDQYGHAKGDAVLRDSAALIISQLRRAMSACRYGGEELMVILPRCGLEMAAVKAEARSAIEGLSEPNGAQVSASMGVASIPATSTSTRELMAAADSALYQAKQDGRNRIVCAPPSSTKSSAAGEAEFRSALEAAE